MNLTYSQETINMSKNKETEKIEYSATDSIVYDLDNQKVFLYKNAKVNYQNSEVTAGFISIHFNTNIIIAKGVYDSLETYVQKDKFPAKYLKLAYSFVRLMTKWNL